MELREKESDLESRSCTTIDGHDLLDHMLSFACLLDPLL